MPPIPLTDLARQHAALERELREACERVVASGRFILGDEVRGFEAEAAAFLGARHAVGVSSGSDALVMALRALGVGRGDDVVTTAYSFFATAESILRTGARPVLVDVDPRTLNIDPALIRRTLTPKTRALLVVHLFGRPADMHSILETADRAGLPVVEDCAQAFGARYQGHAAGTLGRIGCYSFFPAKPLGALGDAGLVVTGDGELAARCRRLRVHGAERSGEHVELGGNWRLDELQAAVLRVKLPHVPRWLGARRAHARAYDAAFEDVPGLQTLAPEALGAESSHAVYAVRVREPERLATHLARYGIRTARYYPRPLHRQPALGDHLAGALPESERAAAECLALPLFPELEESERRRVVEAVREGQQSG